MIDWSTYKFHASGVKNLMVKPRTKGEDLSETTKSYLMEIYIKEVFGREKPIDTPMMRKGTMVETDSISTLERVHGVTYFKNNTTFDNDFVIGTPDVIDKENSLIVDIKSSWDLWTFSKVDEKSAGSDYYYQLLSYMWMTGMKKAQLAYVLVNTPEMFVNDEIYRLSFKMDESKADEYRKNYLFDDIPEEIRVKRFNFDFSEELIENIKNQVTKAREYLKGVTL